MAMASPFPTCHQVFKPCAPNSSLFINLASRSNNVGIRPVKPPVLGTLSFSATAAATNPPENTLKKHHLNLDNEHETLHRKKTSQSADEINASSPIKQKTKDHDFEDRTNRFQINGLMHRIRALSSSNSSTEMLQILEKDSEFRTITDFNHLLLALVIAQELDVCLKLFTNLSSYHQLVPDCSTYSIMIRCYCEKNDLDQAKRALDTILENGFQPNVATITVLINSLCKRGRMQKAFEVFELMGTIGCNPTVQTHNCLLKGLCYVGKVEEALEMLMGMKKTPLKPDVYSYTAVMDGLCKVGRSDEAKELLNEAVAMGLVPNVVTFNTLLQGYSIEGRPLEGIDVLKLMMSNGCVPGYISYSTLLHGLLKWNEIHAALRIYKEMVSLRFEVDERMMGTLVRRLCWKSRKERDLLEDADEVFEKMKKRDSMVDQRTNELMVQALCGGGAKKVDKALAVLKDMVRLGYCPGTVTFDKVIHGLWAQGKTEEAVSTLLLWHASGGIPIRISYDVLIKELNAQGKVFCASYLFGVALKHGVVPIREPLICQSSY